MRGEVIVAFHTDPAKMQPAKHVRSTLITSSLTALRKRGYMPAYERLVPASHKEILLSCIAGVWLPIATGVAHYRTCDALSLSEKEVYEIGMDVSVQVQATFLGTLSKMARSAGVTPWTGLAQFQRLWDRVLDGGGVEVRRVGPKDAQVEVVALPLVDVPYFRLAFRGFIVAGCSMFATRVYGRDVSAARSNGSAVYRMAWA
jgi:hypothetical protein